MIRIFVIEDYPTIIDGLKHEFRPSRDEIEIRGSANSMEEALEKLAKTDCDLIILDLWLKDGEPTENVHALQAKFGTIPIVVFTREDSPFWKRAMYEAGVMGYVMKDSIKAELKNVILKAIKGERVFPDLSFLKGVGLEEGGLGMTYSVILKPYERLIFRLLAAGKDQKTIADAAHRSLSAVEKIIHKYKQKFDVVSVAELLEVLKKHKEI
jgi:DNA-binding NarL/FixJ family response regulator